MTPKLSHLENYHPARCSVPNLTSARQLTGALNQQLQTPNNCEMLPALQISHTWTCTWQDRFRSTEIKRLSWPCWVLQPHFRNQHPSLGYGGSEYQPLCPSSTMICYYNFLLLNAGYKNPISAAHSLFLPSCWSALPPGSSEPTPSCWPWQRTFRQLLGLDEAPALGNSSWSSFWVQRAEAKRADRMCTNPVSSPTPPTTGASLKREGKTIWGGIRAL